VINETLARRYFSNENPIGKAFSDAGQDPPQWTQIVGVAEDAKLHSLRQPAPPLIYLPYTAGGADTGMCLELRARTDMRSITAALRREARAVSAQFEIERITTQNKLVDDSLLRERLLAKLGSFFGALALLLAAIGLYGITSYAVAQRTQEFGIRMALGARRQDILGMVLRDSLLVVAVGAAVGAAAALAVTRFVASLLFGLTAYDPDTVLIAAGVLSAVALAAAFIPAYRAARTDPMVALRYE
jgi:putative ABC transport system permease protein